MVFVDRKVRVCSVWYIWEDVWKYQVTEPKIIMSHLNWVSRWKRKRCQEKHRLWNLYASVLEAKSYATASASNGTDVN